ncbi:MAG: DNA alkylation repair protein [Prevotellaceae bacterium]|nr:DNA alkylation repair protein [Prevotellaceae bacterium]
MNGPVSQSMRDKGTLYKLNWGVALPKLREMAQQYTPSYELAIELWKEPIRECKLMALMLMPPEDMPMEVVDIWMEQTHTQELAEVAAVQLYQHLSYAPLLAFKWMASADALPQITAYTLLGRLFMKGMEPNERGINEFLDQAITALQSSHAGVQHAASNCLCRFAELGQIYAQIMEKALKMHGLASF